MMSPDLQSRPRLAPGCRLNDANKQQQVLLMPERALRLNGPSLEIVQRCDGNHPENHYVTPTNLFQSGTEKSRDRHPRLPNAAKRPARLGLRMIAQL
jgi:hypothetical protein